MKQWVEAADESDFQESDRMLVDLGGNRQLGLYKVNGDYYALSAYCSHQQVSMVHGPLDGHELTCPLHGARFDIRNGAVLGLPAVRGVSSYKVKVQDGKILIRI